MDAREARRLGQTLRELEPAEVVERLTPVLAGPVRFPLLERIGLLVRELCHRLGLNDRLPRPIQPGPLADNHRIAERLFLRTYELELEQADTRRIWSYRKAAWTIDEWPEPVVELYRTRGVAGLRELPTIGERLASLIASWIQAGLSA